MSEGKVTDRDLKLLAAFRELEGTSGIETKDDLINYIKHVGTGLAAAEGGKKIKVEEVADGARAVDPVSITTKFRRISLFFGEEGKGEVTYATWKYEIKCLQKEKAYTPDQIRLGIRRSVKGQASAIMRHLDADLSVDEILKKFEATYGDLDTPVSNLRKLYSCEQNKDESLISYAARVEEIFAEAVELKALTPAQEEVALKSVFYQGLQQPLKQQCNYKFETVVDYDTFKIECRKIEKEMSLKIKGTKKDDKPQSQAMIKQPEQTEWTEMKALLQEMNERIKKLEMEKEQGQEQQNAAFLPC